MPKDTFKNLKPEKQEKIKKAALNEFSSYGYFNSKISRIAKNAGISVGSFYQYFDDINDLFMEVFSRIAEKKMEYIRIELDHTDGGTFEDNLRAMYVGGVKFALNEPECFNVSNIFQTLINTPVFDKIMKYYIETDSNDSIGKLIDQGKKNGEIREALDTELFIKLLTAIQKAVIEYIGLFDSQEKFTEENMKKLSDMAVELLLHGIGR